MKFILTIFLLTFSFAARSQAPPWVWGRQGMGGAEGLAVTTDTSGNVYEAGGFGDSSFNASISFDTVTLQSFRYGGAYLVKYDAAGNFLWARGSNGPAIAYHLATDAQQNVYMMGTADDSVLIFGNDTLPIYFMYTDIFLVKYDAAGNELWARTVRGTSQEYPGSVATDPFGNVFINGITFSDSLVLGNMIIDSVAWNSVFTAKYDNSGNLQWVRTSQDSVTASAAGLVCDSSGNVYTEGYFNSDSITFGQHTLLNADQINGSDLFLVKYDPAGNVIWAHRDGVGNEGEESYAVSSRCTNRILITGIFGGTGPWNFGVSNLNSTSTNGDFFLASYDTAGNPLWATQSSGMTAFGFCVDEDHSGTIYVSGGVDVPGTLIMGSQWLFYSSVSDQSFIASFNASGNPAWAKYASAGGDDQNAIAAGNSGDVFFSGDFIADPTVFGTDSLHNNGWGEVPFVAKLGNTEVGIPVNVFTNSATVFPNPFSSAATIQLKNELHSGKLLIYDVYGKEIETEDGVNGSTISISRNNLPAGIYFFRIDENNKILASGKFTVLDR
ncbi:MAG TPA: T9SS type A sorting domain-containing protein [Bacteroidia bacterium]|jgi:hypothetical protein|nr:T9SS type A sorting domain-containing protein [Bacteroidia bacterium]